ncbi:MAG: response regulator transcription factor [Proteobacteria bacterium]|nr:response regulator transcription factor [Pseudomonadota bacterium]
MAIRVILADDHGVIRDGLRMILETRDDILVVGEAGDGREALILARKLKPEAVIMDIAMPCMNGIEAARRIREEIPDIRIVILSMHASAEHVFRGLDAGVAGYVLKESAGSEVIDALLCVCAGKRYLSPGITGVLIEDYLSCRESASEKNPVNILSPREREVLQLVVEGKTSKEIARVINISNKTVDTYRYRIMNKLGVGDLAGLVRFAIRNGLTGPP